ncbi:SDR family NAD(P)-dependent oxidoreductase, partial [Streptomyces sp. 4N124]|uniref:SDR family NAD(P)-dependent oxidoreductase n=1 Tax=Streptomyces sp. 4N124 TaxID=3457420 RepID=UPI003FCFC069
MSGSGSFISDTQHEPGDAPGKRFALVNRLEPLPAAEQVRVLLDLVRAEAVEVLRAALAEPPAAVRPDLPFKEQGLDSLGLVALHVRVNAATGLALPPTVGFDHPTPAALAAFLRAELLGAGADTADDLAPVARITADHDDPIVVVGFGCRFPGGVDNADDLWRLVDEGRDVLGDFPTDRDWDLDNLFDPDPATPRKSYVTKGGFLETATQFDADFFGISPREALAMDPQQRLVLETAWEALEDTGIAPDSLRGSRTGVFLGAEVHDYGVKASEAPEGLDGYLMIGTAPSVASGRISYTLGLEGPAMTLDTACSGAVVSLHLAAQALRRGECTLALVGGVTVMGSPSIFTSFSRQQGLAPDGRVKAFAAAADGTGFSEGVGLLVVERLSDARRLGHTVHAVVRGTSVNQDGASNGLTAPSGTAQQRLIRQALADAGLTSAEVDAVDAHGTGTRLGDPIEAQAILATYGQDRPAGEPLWLGSVKTNLGHTQAAGGAASMIKMIMAMRHNTLPKTLNVDEPSPHIRWESGQVRLLSEPRPWERGERPRRAGVSAFGISGTNAHVILEEPPAPEEPAAAVPDRPEPAARPLPLVVSARTAPALRAQAERLLGFLAGEPDASLTDIGHSLATTRAALPHRAVVLAQDRAGLQRALGGVVEEQPAPGLFLNPRGHSADTAGRLAFLFTGQGSQRLAMGRELCRTHPVFAKALEDAIAHLDLQLDVSLWDVLFAAEGSAEAELLHQTRYAQCALFAVEVALFRLVESWGVRPDYLAGHSVGELAAAHVAGVLSLQDAATLVAARGRLMQELPAGGAMVALQAAEDEVGPLLTDRVSIAAINGPTSVVVSGDETEVLRVKDHFDGLGRKSKRLRVSHAFHSPLMEPMLADFRRVASIMTYRAPQIPVVSNVTGQLATAEQLCSPDYWVKHVRGAVRFADGIRFLEASGVTGYLELGPDAVLSAMGQECVTASGAIFVPALRRERDEQHELLSALALLHTCGTDVDWGACYDGLGARRIPLPTYAFQRRRYWLSAPHAGGDAAGLGQIAAGHPLLGSVLRLAAGDEGTDGVVLTGRVSLRSHPWLADHVIAGVPLLPGTAFVELAVRAADEVGCALVEELTLEAPLALPAAGGVALQVVVGAADGEGRRTVGFFSRPEDADDDGWTRHAAGLLAPSAQQEASAESFGMAQWPPAGAESVDISTLYPDMAENGYGYGPAFHGLRAVWRQDGEVYAEVALDGDAALQAGAFGLHPALLDAALHATDFASPQPVPDGTRLPFAWTGVSLYSSGAAAIRVRIAARGTDSVSLSIADPSGAPVARIDSFVLRPVDTGQLRAAHGGAAPLRVEWSSITAPAAAGTDGWRILRLDAAGDGGVLEAVRANTTRALAAVQDWLAGESAGETRLAIVTSGAVTATGQDGIDLAMAPVWGLVRAAQAEHPGRIVLVDTDAAADERLLFSALATGEPELAVRGGEIRVPRLVRTAAPGDEVSAPWDADSTVLVTGGTSGLGALVARHLVAEHGVRHLLLTSRRGPDTPGAGDLREHLTAAGATVTLAACDAADRDALTAVLNAVDPDHPVRGIVHAAGVIDDGLIASLTPERFDTVLAPKADAAWHLHELAGDLGLDLTAFVLFSSTAGFLDGAGQANYAAANVFLDALAQHRAAQGLAATSLAWGLWTGEVGMGAALDASALQRIAKLGLEPLSAEENLSLLDASLRGGTAAVVPVRVDGNALRDRADGVPAVLRALVPATVSRRTASAAPAHGGAVSVADSLSGRLAGLSAADRTQALLDLVRGHVAAVLGHDGANAVDPGRAFSESGFDSLAAVELRNSLNAATGLRLTATLVFDYPTPRALAEHIASKLAPQEGQPATAQAAPVTAVTDDDPIVIVGMSCRYPGGVGSPEELWELVAQGRDAISLFPADRGWDVDALYDPEPGVFGKSSTREGGFLYDAAEFDPEFFGISPREAQAMDPQQRLLLETSWEALERAGIDPLSARGTSTGVFAGVMYHDWGSRLGGRVADEYAGYLGNGSLASVVSGRVAYTLGLEGPAVTVDTACSSSLVALHWAVQALRAGECSLALAGGVTVMSTPDTFIDMNRQRGLSSDGRCKSFAASADGTGWGEGAGVLVLERLSDARAAGHRVLAVVKGSAVNQDGASNGLTAPNGPSQQRVIEQALVTAGLTPAEVDAVEAHGTGTTLGDPIEAHALLATYGQQRPDSGTPLQLGSIKSNLGHTQAAAGVAGIIKTVMAIRHGMLPKTLHVDEPSPQVDWEAGAVQLLTEAKPWPENDRPRRAGVSSFGISGTNAHVIIEQAPPAEPAEPVSTQAPVLAWPVSGKTPAAVRAQATRLRSFLDTLPDGELTAAGLALATSRAALEQRAVAIGTGRTELARALDDITDGNGITQATPGKLAFLFTGQGAQRIGMGRELYEAFPVFAEAFDAVLAELDGLPLREVMWGEDAEALNRTEFTQPALFAIEVALYRLVESWGIRPDYLAGHSIGEFAAAHVAGVLSLADAAKLVAARGRLMQALPAGGAMAALQATEEEVRPLLADGVGIAAVNGPTAVVVSGDETDVLRIKAHFEAEGRKSTRLKVSHAFHSPLMEPMLADFRDVAASISYGEPSVPIVSTLTGETATATELGDPDYWVSHVRDAVRFADAVRTLDASGVTSYLELGPDAVLTAMGRQTIEDAAFIPALRRNRAEMTELVFALARLHSAGTPIDWTAYYDGTGAQRADLPTYAFEKREFWLDTSPEPAVATDATGHGQVAAGHPLLSSAITLPDGGGAILTGRLSTATHAWIADHTVLGTTLLPGTGLVELAIRAGDEAGTP